MCVSCMEFVTLVHDPNHMPDPLIARPVLDLLRRESYAQYNTVMSDDQAAVFLIILCGTLLAWKDD